MTSLRHCMGTAILLTAASAAAQEQRFSHPPDAAMVFHYAGNGGSCSSCEWIAAEGRITEATPERFEDFVRAGRASGYLPRFLRLNSTGGDTTAAITLGSLIRAGDFDTVVGRTEGPLEENYIRDDGSGSPGQCVGACVFTFAGGNLRFRGANDGDSQAADHSQIGLRQARPPTEQAQSAHAFSSGLNLNRRLLAFLTAMNVNPQLLALVPTKPDDIRWLTVEELLATRLDNSVPEYRVEIAVKDADAASVVVRWDNLDSSIASTLYCDENGRLLMQADVLARHPVDLEAMEAWGLYQQVTLRGEGFDIPLTRRSIDISYTADRTRIMLLYQVGERPIEDFAAMRRFTFDSSTSRYAAEAASDLSFELPRGFTGMSLLPRACLQ